MSLPMSHSPLAMSVPMFCSQANVGFDVAATGAMSLPMLMDGGVPTTNIGSDVANWPCDIGTDVAHAANIASDIVRPRSDVAYDIEENAAPFMEPALFVQCK